MLTKPEKPGEQGKIQTERVKSDKKGTKKQRQGDVLCVYHCNNGENGM